MGKDNATELMLDRIADMIIDKFLEEKDLKKFNEQHRIKEGRIHEN